MNYKILIVLVLGASWSGYEQIKTPSPAVDLPDVLRAKSGKKITNLAEWTQQRRPEILSLFEENVYGQLPKEVDSIRFQPIVAEKWL